jgi:hypothetical protein
MKGEKVRSEERREKNGKKKKKRLKFDTGNKGDE